LTVTFEEFIAECQQDARRQLENTTRVAQKQQYKELIQFLTLGKLIRFLGACADDLFLTCPHSSTSCRGALGEPRILITNTTTNKRGKKNKKYNHLPALSRHPRRWNELARGT
jgi:hypothetical protein